MLQIQVLKSLNMLTNSILKSTSCWLVSSILLAIMSSGMNGQNFAFNGYLPIDKKEKIKKIKQLENFAKKSGQTQILWRLKI